MIVHVSLLTVMLLLFVLTVVMAVGERVVIVLVGVPVRTMLPLVHRIVRVVVRDVVMVVNVCSLGVIMFGLIALSLGSLDDHTTTLCHCGPPF